MQSTKSQNLLHSLDLNLLKIFHVLYLEKNVTRTSKKINLTQSAVSHSLVRLRQTFKDPLFVRSGKGIVPTPKAEEMFHQVDELLSKATDLVTPKSGFDPKTSQNTFKMLTTDYFEISVLPQIFKKLISMAPHVKILSNPTPSFLPQQQLESGDTHVAIAGFYKDLPPGYYQQKLFEDEFVVISRKNHPRIQGQLTLNKYLNESHIRIALHSQLKGEFDQHLEKQGIHRTVSLGLSNFTSPSWILSETDLLLTLPRRLAKKYSDNFNIRIYEAPMEIKKLTVMQVWHERVHQDPFHKWMRELIKESLK